MENKHTVYFNMCHHYRKILNAKPRVDTSLPKVRQIKENNDQWNLRLGEPSIHTKISGQENQKLQTELRSTKINVRQSSAPAVISQQYYYQRHLQNKFEKAERPFTKTILKNNNAQSKVRTSRIHCPPHKKHVQLTVSNETNSHQAKRNVYQIIQKTATSANNMHVKFPKPSSVSSVNSYSRESSEDSAYNEGECNLTSSDSRGSTPQNSINKQKSEQILKISSQSMPLNSTRLTSKHKMEDSAYIQFLKDITNDILKKNLVTNKALRSVFQQHVKLNKYDLQLEKMLNEITKLQERLGVPEDVEFDDEDYGLGRINLNDDVKKVADETEGQEITRTVTLPSTAAKIGMDDVASGEKQLSPIAASIDKDHAQNDYSDNFSEENSYSGSSSLSQCEKSNRSTNRDDVSIETQNEATSEIEENVQELENRSEKYSDVEEDISHLESDSEISEVS